MNTPNTEYEAVLRLAYKWFNDRRVDELLWLLTENVEWPDVAGGKVLHGRAAVRAYWMAQFAVAEPIVEPRTITVDGDEALVVVDQRISSRAGEVIRPSTVVSHRYWFRGGLIARMEVGEAPAG